MSLHYFAKREMLRANKLPLSCYRKILQNLSHLWLPNSPDLNSVDNSMWEMLQEKVYKTRITDLELSTTLLTSVFRNDNIAQLKA